MNTRSRCLFRSGMILALAGLCAVTSAGAASECCIRADVEATIVLPDGSSHEPGPIRICLADRLSPVAGLHQTFVDSQPVGIFVSRVAYAEDPPQLRDPIIRFRQTARGHWVLEAYGVPDGSRMAVYWLEPQPSARAFRSVPPPVASDRSVVLIAARSE